MGNSPSQAIALVKARNNIKNVMEGTESSTMTEEEKSRVEEKNRIRDQRDAALVNSYKAKQEERAARKSMLKEKWANHRKNNAA